MIVTSDGTAAAPAWTFESDRDTGSYWPISSNRLRIACGGSDVAQFGPDGIQLATALALQWGPNFASADAILIRNSANTLAQRNGNADQAFLVGGANGVATGYKTLSELTTVAAAATTDTAIEIPANAIVLGVSVRVTVVIPTAATFTVIGTTTSTAFQTGASVSTVVNTTDAGTKSCPYLNTAAQTIRFTPNASPADNTGRVRITIHFIEITPATS